MGVLVAGHDSEREFRGSNLEFQSMIQLTTEGRGHKQALYSRKEINNVENIYDVIINIFVDC